MKIRQLQVEENGSTRPLYEEVFSEDSQAFVDYYYTEKTKDNQIYVLEEEDEIRAMVHLNPYQICVNGSLKDVNYIVAVATQAEYRKRGYMAALLNRCLNDMYTEGQSFTYLMPAAESIYLPFDFRTVYEQEKRWYVAEEEQKSGTGAEDDIEVTDAVESDCETLAQYANENLGACFQVYAKRDAAYYKRLIKEYASDGGSLKLYKRAGKIIDCKIAVPEIEEAKPKIMIRIIDIRRMLMSMQIQSIMGTCFTVTDPIIKENNRCVFITGTEFSGVMLMDEKPEKSEGTITVSALGSLLFGAKTVEEVCGEEGVEMSERMKEELGKLIPLSRIYLNEVV